ncbi:DNA primase [Sphingomicrobium astaxanthinifaciens]|uniref:DNA primase n=1 Tax=Sphingomicrobium astaxanthinifaciens TaxID=1227949 RepID=UPI001FCBE609|nr:DNA primase [Sphingomicrobium astaxanthinifaciens]MCJ7422323.1 DNA primase [Sphingomicrobium astaxanthinifaciens]
MSLPPSFLDELRARTRVSAVVGNDVKLLKAGKEYKACCPFHDEKTPSFYVNDQKGFYHCFGCGAHGDAISYLVDGRGMGFMDAVKELAAKAGMEVPAPDPRAQQRAERRAGLVDVTEAAADWYEEQLAGIEGAGARAYLDKRGLSAAIIKRFRLGFAPDDRGRLKRALDRFGVPKLVESGMLINPEDGNREPYDRFRGRLMIPIRDPRGRVIAFGGRILGDGEPKYLNSPETPLFDKGRQLYNLDRAQAAARKAGRVIVVEGYMDVIGLDAAGIGEAVAPLGTALTEDQLRLLWRLTPAPILCFDGDAAGQRAAIRAAERALPLLGPDHSLSFVELPAGQDPDDVVRAGGRAAFEALLEAPEPLVERLWRHEVAAGPLDTPEQRAGLKQRLFDHARAIQNPGLSQLYRDDWLARFDRLVGRERGGGGGPGGGQRKPWKKNKDGRWVPPAPPVGAAARRLSADGIVPHLLEALLIGYARHPQRLLEDAEDLVRLELSDPRLAALREKLLDAAFSAESLDPGTLLPILADERLDSPSRPLMGYSFVKPDADRAQAAHDLSATLETILAAAEIESALEAATERLEREFSDEAFGEQQRLLGLRRDATDRLAVLARME